MRHLDTLVEDGNAEPVSPNFAVLDGSKHWKEEGNRDQGICEARVMESDLFSKSNHPETDRERHELTSQGEQQDNFSGLLNLCQLLSKHGPQD